MYLSKIQNVFVRNKKCICPNWKMYLSKLENVFHTISTNHLAHLSFISNLSSKCICPKYKMYSSKIQNVFVQNTKCICLNKEIYFTPLLRKISLNVFVWYVFVQTAKCICPTYKMDKKQFMNIEHVSCSFTQLPKCSSNVLCRFWNMLRSVPNVK